MNFNFNFIVGGNQLPALYGRGGTPFQGALRGGSRRSRRGGLGPEALRLILAADYDLEDMSDLIVNQLHDTYMEEEAQPRPVSTRTLRSLERNHGRELGGQDGACSICLETYGKRDACIRLPCAHVFHEACVERWFQAQHTCPTCRHGLPEQTPEEEAELAREASEIMVRESLECGGGAAAAACCPGEPCAIFNMVDVSLAGAKAAQNPSQTRRRRRAGRQHISIFNLGIGGAGRTTSSDSLSSSSSSSGSGSGSGSGSSSDSSRGTGERTYGRDFDHRELDTDFYFEASNAGAPSAPNASGDGDFLLGQLLRQLAASEARSSLEASQRRRIAQPRAPTMVLPNGQAVDAVDEGTLRTILDDVGIEHDEFDDLDDLRMMVSIVLRESYDSE